MCGLLVSPRKLYPLSSRLYLLLHHWDFLNVHKEVIYILRYSAEICNNIRISGPLLSS